MPPKKNIPQEFKRGGEDAVRYDQLFNISTKSFITFEEVGRLYTFTGKELNKMRQHIRVLLRQCQSDLTTSAIVIGEELVCPAGRKPLLAPGVKAEVYMAEIFRVMKVDRFPLFFNRDDRAVYEENVRSVAGALMRVVPTGPISGCFL